ncbi:MAG: FAD/NAD(P)-binding oxidoreductase [Crocinitomicaceae bacterium]|nr:FAD/NAD(P)-binding oxidoreductase [Crocinitomicaceae bacterium]
MIIIIGNGISGVTAARNIRKKSDEPITIISAESKYFFSRTALMYVYMGHMKFEHTEPYEPHFWEKNRINLKQTYVESIDTDKKTLSCSGGEELQYSKLVLATGSKPNKFGWKGQDANRVQGLYSKQDLESMEVNTEGIKSAVVVGGGLIGIEMAEMLLTRQIEVHFLVREKTFWSGVLPEQDSKFIMKHFENHHGLHMHYGEELDEIHVGEYDNRKSKKGGSASLDTDVVYESTGAVGITTKSGQKIDCQFVGLTAGVSPNIDFIKNSKIDTNRGILVNRYLETSVEDVYAIGDCAEFTEPVPGRRPIEQVWYTGKFMGETLAHTITGNRVKYEPGYWFNSAKFFDIEYQTYGDVRSKLQEGEAEFIYQHPKEDVLLHFVFDATSHRFIGINNFGVRLRHLVFNEWLTKEATIEEVLQDLKSANFDPEFYATYESDIVNQFNSQFGTNITSAKRKWWQNLITS